MQFEPDELPIGAEVPEGQRMGLMESIPRWSLPDTADLPGYGAKDAIILNMVKGNQILRDQNMILRDEFMALNKLLGLAYIERELLRVENRRLKRLKYKPGKKPKKARKR